MIVASTTLFRPQLGHLNPSNLNDRFFGTAHATCLARANSSPSSRRPQCSTEILVASTNTVSRMLVADAADFVFAAVRLLRRLLPENPVLEVKVPPIAYVEKPRVILTDDEMSKPRAARPPGRAPSAASHVVGEAGAPDVRSGVPGDPRPA